MPIPILVGLGYVALGAFGLTGVGKGVSGVSKLNKAKSIGKEAKEKHTNALQMTERKRKQVQKRASEYGKQLAAINDNLFKPLRQFLQEIDQNPRAKEIEIPSSISTDVSSISDFKMQVLEPVKDFMGVLTAAGVGSAASTSAVGLVTLLGSASTGTAIGTLSGAAATNATLAWLGGGSLATGGGGMAAGSIMLGGIAVAPALFIGGLILSSKGDKALTQAHLYRSEVNVANEKLKSTRVFMSKIVKRTKELSSLLKQLEAKALQFFNQLDSSSFSIDDDEHIDILQQTMLFSTAISEIMRTPILTEKGNLTKRSHSIQMKYTPLIEEQNDVE